MKEKEVMAYLEKAFRPEFLNRIDKIIFFKTLGIKDIKKIVKRLLDDLKVRLLKEWEITFRFEDEALNLLCKKGYDPMYGARHIIRTFEQLIVEPLSEKLTAEEILSGESIAIDAKGDEIVIKAKTREKLPDEYILTESEVFNTRRSEAIMVVDLCGSTRISNKYGNIFFTDLVKVIEDKVQKISQEHKARFLKGLGDGFLVTFLEPEQAVQSAIEILKVIQKYNKDVETKRRIDLRISISSGEVEIDSRGDRRGERVNMGFRLDKVKGKDLHETVGGIKKSEMPERNRILITEHVLLDLEEKGFVFRKIGFFELEGILGRHKIYEVLWE
ncbi:MAG: hypothetical protein HY754_13170 [Nitrospirae bacterium]|nr:hypothetical protein [Nitrospirota bacterium]